MATTPTTAPAREQELLDAARAGDQEAFPRLVGPHRAELHAHRYRMLGSVHDAEDALQEALLRAWRGLARFEGAAPSGPGSTRSRRTPAGLLCQIRDGRNTMDQTGFFVLWNGPTRPETGHRAPERRSRTLRLWTRTTRGSSRAPAPGPSRLSGTPTR